MRRAGSAQSLLSLRRLRAMNASDVPLVGLILRNDYGRAVEESASIKVPARMKEVG